MPVRASDIRARRADPPADQVARPEAAPPRQRATRRTSSGPRWRGCIPGGAMAMVVVALIPVLAVALMVLSVLGTFFGARGLPVPLMNPAALWAALAASPGILALAFGGQVGLSVAQYGGRQLARDDRRWWLLYVGSLALSAWWNWRGYGPPLAAQGVPWALSLLLVVALDAVPELALIREDRPARAE